MADLPRWINHPAVDSIAMLWAFLHWLRQASPEEQREVEHLYTIDHATVGLAVTKPTLPSGGSLRSLPCQAENCRRCLNLQGGYQFRWYDARWVNSYNQMKREGAVTLPLA